MIAGDGGGPYPSLAEACVAMAKPASRAARIHGAQRLRSRLRAFLAMHRHRQELDAIA